MLESAAARMGSLTTVGFTLTHKEGTTPVLPGIAAREIEGLVAAPDRAELEVDAVATAFGVALQIRMVVVGPDLPPIVVPQVMRHW